MEFLRQLPTVSLAPNGECRWYSVDLTSSRPAFEELANSQDSALACRDQLQSVLERPRCPMSSAMFMVDQVGLMAIMTFKKDVILGQAKNSASVVLNSLPDGMMSDTARRDAIQHLHPLDQVDRDRILAWHTLQSVRPKRECGADRESHRAPARTLDALLAQSDSSSGEDEDIPAPRLALGSAPAIVCQAVEPPAKRQRRFETTDAGLSDNEEFFAPEPESTVAVYCNPAALWEERARLQVTIIVVAVGEVQHPIALKFRRCHHETRRQILLQTHVKAEWTKPGLQHVLRVALRLATEGAFPPPFDDGHGRKCHFLKRCQTALLAIDPAGVTDVTQLPPDVVSDIRRMLGGTNAPFTGCFQPQCIDRTPSWTTGKALVPAAGPEPLEYSMCAWCGCPMIVGREHLLQSARPALATRSAYMQLMSHWHSSRPSSE